MKNNTYFLLCLVLLLSLAQACKSDDEGSGMNNENMVETFDNSCCKEPHLEACVGGAKVYVPNAFTPNGDGINDLFLVEGNEGISKVVSFKVFKADGTMVYEASDFPLNDPSFGWNGAFPDGTLEQAIYSYSLSIENIGNQVYDFEGTVCCRIDGPNDFPCVDLEKNCAYSSQHDGNGGFDPALPNFEDCQ